MRYRLTVDMDKCEQFINGLVSRYEGTGLITNYWVRDMRRLLAVHEAVRVCPFRCISVTET